jgi:hypothetical protein
MSAVASLGDSSPSSLVVEFRRNGSEAARTQVTDACDKNQWPVDRKDDARSLAMLCSDRISRSLSRSRRAS